MLGRSRGTIINHTKTRKSGTTVVYVDNPKKINLKKWMWQFFLPALEEQETLEDMKDMMNKLSQVKGFTKLGFENEKAIRPDSSVTNKSPAGGQRPFPGGILTNYAIKQTIITKKAEEDKEKKAMAAAIKQWEPDMFQSVPSVVGGGGGAARPTPAGAGGGGGGGSHPSSASYYRNRPFVHGDKGRGTVDVLRDAGDAATAAVVGAGAAVSSIWKRATKGKKKLTYREQVGKGIKHLKKSKEAMKLLNDYQKAIEIGLGEAEAGRNVDMEQLQQMLINAEQLKQYLYGGKTVVLGGGHRKSRKRRRRKRRKTRRRKRRRHTRRRRKSKRRKSRKKR